MWYEMTFFKLEILPSEWKGLFDTIFTATRHIRCVVVRNGTKIDFYLKSDKHLDLLNSKLYPFYLSGDIQEKDKTLLNEPSGGLSLISFPVGDDLLKLFEKKGLDGKDITRVDFKLSKWNLLKDIPVMKISYTQNGVKKQSNIWPSNHIYGFLAFNLTSSINSEISKVKPVLASSNLNFSLDDDGMLDVKGLSGDKKFSTRSYDFWRHSLIIGQSGSGKSVLIKLLIEDLCKKFGQEYCVVLIDPHASIDSNLSITGNRKVIDFKNIATNLFVNVGQATLSTELTMDLFSTVLDIRGNQTLERVLKYSLNLLFGVNKMTLKNLKVLLTDTLSRKEILKQVTDSNILKFFETEFQSINTAHYADAILPILNMITEMDFISNIPQTTGLVKEINENFLVSLSIKQTELGTNITKIIGGAIIAQVFTIMQAKLTNKKVILVIDEVSVVQTPSLIQILSEARKFGLTVVLAQQYLMQVSGEILMSIFANMVNYFCFKLARDDAETVARNLNCEIDQYFLKNKNDPKEMQELAVKLLTDLNPREVIARIMSGEKYFSPFKAKTVPIQINNIIK